MGLIEIIVQKFVVVDREITYFCEFLYAKRPLRGVHGGFQSVHIKAPVCRRHFEENSKCEISDKKKTTHRVESDGW